MPLVIATPAIAADATVTDWAGLVAATATPGTVTLGADITGPGLLALGGDITLELAGHTLSINSPFGPAVTTNGHTLTIEGPSGAFVATGQVGPAGFAGVNGADGAFGGADGQDGGTGGAAVCGVPAI